MKTIALQLYVLTFFQFYIVTQGPFVESGFRIFEDIYFAELPIQYHGTKIKWSLFYIFDELTDEEKIKYDPRSEYITVTKETVVELYTKKVRKKKK